MSVDLSEPRDPPVTGTEYSNRHTYWAVPSCHRLPGEMGKSTSHLAVPTVRTKRPGL
jgi:hypothetical protein